MENYFVKLNSVLPPNSRVDRFVLPRESVVEMRRRRSWHAGCHDTKTVDIWDPKHQKRMKYQGYLNEVFGIKSQRNRNCVVADSEPNLWPCSARKKRFMTLADCILDLPTYNFITFPDLLDWSRKNILVAALGQSYHMFGWHEQVVIGQGMARSHIRCCKFDPRGDILLLGTENFEGHDGVSAKFINMSKCTCVDDVMHLTTALDWSPTGNSFVIGCSNGVISSYGRDMSFIGKWSGIMGSPILTVKVSPDARFVATTGVGSLEVHIITWPHLQYLSTLHFDWLSVKTMTWHPWRSARLAIGADEPGFQPRLGFLDAPSSKIRETSLGGSSRILDTMLFSHRTGEMVLSLWDPDRLSEQGTAANSTLVVMSDPNTVVDQSESRVIMDRVRTMVFNPDGTKLATATEAEDLMIWNFLPEDNKKKHLDKSKRFYAMPSYIDELVVAGGGRWDFVVRSYQTVLERAAGTDHLDVKIVLTRPKDVHCWTKASPKDFHNDRSLAARLQEATRDPHQVVGLPSGRPANTKSKT